MDEYLHPTINGYVITYSCPNPAAGPANLCHQ